MSKYYSVNDVSRAIIELPDTENGYSGSYDKAEILNALEDLPTIEVSEDCISRADLLKTIDDNVSQQYRDTYETYGLDLWGLFVRIVKDAPSVVPSRAEVEWRYESEIVCEKCGYEIPRIEKLVGETVLMDSKDWDYCPNCGAKMKGAE